MYQGVHCVYRLTQVIVQQLLASSAELLEARRKTLNESEDPPGDKLDPSKSSSNCCNSTIFTHPMICTDGIIIGNGK